MQVYSSEETHLPGFCPVQVLHLQPSNPLLILQSTPEQGMEQGSAAGTGCQVEAAGAGTTPRMETAQRQEELAALCHPYPSSVQLSQSDIGTAHSLLPFHLNEPHRFVPGLNYQVITTL